MRWKGLFFALVMGISAWVQAEQIDSIRLNAQDDRLRIIIELDKAVAYRFFSLDNPKRLVIDFSENVSLKKDYLKNADVNISGGVLQKIRSGMHEGNRRLVFDLNASESQALDYLIFDVPARANNRHRLIVDIKHRHNSQALNQVQINAAQSFLKEENKNPYAMPMPTRTLLQDGSRVVRVVIDPGHGGQDPGAIVKTPQGRSINEKDIVLSVSLMLESYLNQYAPIKVMMTRRDDRFVALADRLRYAREQGADFFVSVHANYFQQQQVSGAIIFALSEKSATSELAKWLADKENKADLLGGSERIALGNIDENTRDLLLDLSMKTNMEASLIAGAALIDQMGGSFRMHSKSVEQAPFFVLRSPDIPSLLLEVGFLSNYKELKRLMGEEYQKSIAASIGRGIVSYFNQLERPSPYQYIEFTGDDKSKDSMRASRDQSLRAEQDAQKAGFYVVQPGDTLSQIAEHFEISESHLMKSNDLKNGHMLFVGQRLIIPGDDLTS